MSSHGDTDVSIADMCDNTTDGVTVVEGTGTIWCVLAGIFPFEVVDVDAMTNAGVIDELGAGVFTETTDV